MFNNPFDSFHNTVSEAKNEREQLDQLLTISTPRERLLLALVVLMILALSMWLVFGSVSQTLSIHGFVLAQPGDREEGILVVSMIDWVDRNIVDDISSEMPAIAKISQDGQRPKVARGAIRRVVEMASIEDSAKSLVGPMSANWIVVDLESELDTAPLGGRECTVAVELGKQSPLALFASRLL